MLRSILIALDQLLNTIIRLDDGWGSPDEMLSARAWRLRNEHTLLYKVIDGIFFWDKDHCQECYEIEKLRKQLPKEYQ